MLARNRTSSPRRRARSRASVESLPPLLIRAYDMGAIVTPGGGGGHEAQMREEQVVCVASGLAVAGLVGVAIGVVAVPRRPARNKTLRPAFLFLPFTVFS